MRPFSVAAEQDAEASGADATPRRPLGSFIRDVRDLDERQIDRILAYQRERGLRFGEAAVALRLADRSDVLEALSQQFQYTSGFAGREASEELVTAADPFGDQADAFRELRSRLILEVPEAAARRPLAVISADAGDGKTYLAANLAVAFSQLGERTLLIDADIRTPRQHRLFGVDGSGLSSVLAGFAEANGAVRPVSGLAGLYVLPAGAVPPNPLELLQRRPFRRLMREMQQNFTHIIVDTPAAIRGADSRVIAAECGAALVVGRKGRSRMLPLEGLLASLARGCVSIAGVVMNEH
jgi:protein-tyrosine kinase